MFVMRNMDSKKVDVPPMKMVLVTGGVISGVGKGLISSSIGFLLKTFGYHVSAIKIDPYINIDAGTFSPYEHGEVYVLDDGGEVDLDLGNYERFLSLRLTRDNNITTGKIFQQVIERERRGDYLGKTVQTVPHITDAIVEWVERVAAIPVDGSNHRPDVCIIELGGTIGDIEGMPFVKAFEKFQRPLYRDHLMTVHVSLILDPKSTGEQKTKPMQNSVRELRASGLNPDLLICRSERPLKQHLKMKIAKFGLVEPEQVIGVPDLPNIYKLPLVLHQQNVLELIVNRLKLPDSNCLARPYIFYWTRLSLLCDSIEEEVTIAIVGKYVQIADAYASVNKALRHAAIHANRKLVIKYVQAEHLEDPEDRERTEDWLKAWNDLKMADGIVVPGGFGGRGVEGKILACKYARENKIPFLGICLGMQCAVIEFARNVCGIEKANSTEFDKEISGDQQVVIDMPEHDPSQVGMGGTMRLGLRDTVFLTRCSKLRRLYDADLISERHRHRYEVNPGVVPMLCEKGLLFVGMGTDEKRSTAGLERQTKPSTTLIDLEEADSSNVSSEDDGYSVSKKEIADKDLLLEKVKELCKRGDSADAPVRMEIVELEGHPYFVAVQYHPEYLSHPFQPSPPFFGLICAASNQMENLYDLYKNLTVPDMLHDFPPNGDAGKNLLRASHSFVRKSGVLPENLEEDGIELAVSSKSDDY